MEPAWHKSACILCENNCGIEIQIGGDDLTDTAHRDAIAGTPWHKVVPVAIERIP